jgi:hypothetical protein
LAFIDLEKAFDKVNRNKLLDIIIADDIPNQIISAIYNIYQQQQKSVKMGPDSSEWRPSIRECDRAVVFLLCCL